MHAENFLMFAALVPSVGNLKAPGSQMAMVFPSKSLLKCFCNFSNKILFCFSFTSSTAWSLSLIHI